MSNNVETLKKLKIQTARDRSQAYIRYLRRFSLLPHASPSIQQVVEALTTALKKLDKNLEKLSSSPLLGILDEDQVEATIHYKTQNILKISAFIALILGGEVASIPGGLISPLRREIQRLFPDSELIIVATSDLNYSIFEMSQPLRELLTDLQCEIPENLPTKIFRVAIPEVKFDQALLHCILAHEFGHPLFVDLKIEDKISPISVTDEKIKQIYKELKSTPKGDNDKEKQSELPFGEVMLKAVVTKKVNRIIPNWVEEIASDLFGLIIFGPAYILAFLHFSSSVFRLNSASESHPPTRFRLKVLLNTCDDLFPRNKLSDRTASFLQSWVPISDRNAEDLSVWEKIALETIEEQSVPEKLKKAIMENFPRERIFSLDTFGAEVGKLSERIDAMVPPAEFLRNGKFEISSIPSMLNAAWESYLGGLEEFKKCLPNSDELSTFELNLKFNEFILKSMELQNVKQEWGNAANDIVNGKNKTTSS